MTTAKELRQHCKRLTSEREEELKSALNDYFYSTFIVGHRPFRAVIGNKKCKPIPINASYSEYCANEQKVANEMYSEFISALYSVPVEIIKTYDGYTLFCGFKFDRKISSKCATFIRRLMVHNGIEEYYEDGKYRGIKVYNNPN